MSLLRVFAQHKFQKIFNKGWASEESFLAFLKAWLPAQNIPKIVKNKCEFSVIEANGTKIYKFSPKKENKRNKWRVLYFYGSAYVMELSDLHIKYFIRFVKLTGVTLYVPLLPTSKQLDDPNFDRKKVYENCIITYKEILKDNPAENVIIAGDSSGGGLTLLMSTLIRDNNLPNPNKLFLMNPLDNCDLSDYQPHTKNGKFIFPKNGLLTAIKMFTKGDDIKDPCISPYFSDFSILPKVYLFYGTYEEALFQMQRLEKKLIENNKLKKCFVYNKTFHDFFVVPIPESKRFLKDIKSILND